MQLFINPFFEQNDKQMPKMPILKLSLALGKLSDMGENTGDDERVSSCECLTRRIRAG
jgi:hypothetical protein